MPEISEVEIIKRKLEDKKLTGAVIGGFYSHKLRALKTTPDVKKIKIDILGRKINTITRHGKVLSFGLSGAPKREMSFHFRMSGRLELINSGAGPVKDKAVRAIVDFKDGRKILFRDPRRFGVLWYGDPEKLKNDPYLGSLGPDMLKVSSGIFLQSLKKHENAVIKAVLLNQKVVSGIGNIIADEALWRTKIHPQTRVSYLGNAKLGELYKNLKFVIRRIIFAGGSTFRDWAHPDGQEGGYAKIRWVYARAGERCLRCSGIIKKIIVAGRGTHVCLNCQGVK